MKNKRNELTWGFGEAPASSATNSSPSFGPKKTVGPADTAAHHFRQSLRAAVQEIHVLASAQG